MSAEVHKDDAPFSWEEFDPNVLDSKLVSDVAGTPFAIDWWAVVPRQRRARLFRHKTCPPLV